MADQDQNPGDQQPPSRPPPFAGPFLFVNKNATNLKTRKREEVFAVRSHAMQIARRARKQNTSASSKSSQPQVDDDPKPRALSTQAQAAQEVDAEGESEEETAANQGVASPSRTQSSAWQNFGPGSSRRSKSPEHRPNLNRSSFSEVQGSHSQNRDSNLPIIDNQLPSEHLAFLMQYVQTANPTTPLGNGSSDPFAAAALPISAFFNSLIQFWRVGFMSNFWPARIYLDSAHSVSRTTDDWMRGVVICNEAMLHGLFAGALSFTTNYLPSTAATPALWAKGVHHHGKCLEATRTRLAMPNITEEEALNMIHQSATYSFHCGDLDASGVHRSAGHRILENLEHGLDEIHSILKYLLILCDILTAGHVPRRPAMELTSWAPKSWHEEEALSEFDDIFAFDPSPSMRSDRELLGISGNTFEMADDQTAINLLSLITLHREALYANQIALELSLDPVEGRARADIIYNWMSLRQYALTGLSVELYMDMIELQSAPTTESSNHASSHLKLQQVLNTCILLATSYTFQLIMRLTRSNPSLGYIPIHHLRNRLTLLMTLMSDARRAAIYPGASSVVATETLLFLLFGGAVLEETGGIAPAFNDAGLEELPQRVPPPTMTGSSAGMDPNLLHTKWFGVHFSMVCHRLGISDWQKAKIILERFIYDAITLDDFVKLLVERSGALLNNLGFNTPQRPVSTQSGHDIGVVSGTTTTATGSASRSRLSSRHLGRTVPTAGSSTTTVHNTTAPPFLRSLSTPTSLLPSSHHSPGGLETNLYLPTVPEVGPLSPDNDFATGIWEHMGLGLDEEFDVMSRGEDEVENRSDAGLEG